jgi:hypothetical protein
MALIHLCQSRLCSKFYLNIVRHLFIIGVPVEINGNIRWCKLISCAWESLGGCCCPFSIGVPVVIHGNIGWHKLICCAWELLVDWYSSVVTESLSLPLQLPMSWWRTEVPLKFRVFWDVLPCSQIDVDLCFRGVCCPDDGDSTHLWNVGQHLFDYMSIHPRRLWTSYSLPWEPEISQRHLCLKVALLWWMDCTYVCSLCSL